MENQEKTWDKIASKWDDYRKEAFPITKNFLENKGGKILDLGCGSGRNCLKLKKDTTYYCVDFSSEMLKLAEKNLKEKQIKAKFFHTKSNKLPFEDNFFDAIIFYATLHCIETNVERRETLKELFRTLKPKSQALISTWGKNSPRLKNKEKESYMPWTIKESEKVQRFTYIYKLEELKKEIEDIGFKIIEISEDINIHAIVEKI